jgi:hypothetical protein
MLAGLITAGIAMTLVFILGTVFYINKAYAREKQDRNRD